MNAKHTPGPWTTNARGSEQVQYITADGKTIAQAWDFPEAEANARLITAAPELLTACQTAEAALIDAECDMDGRCSPSLAHALDDIRAAIAKATGEK